MDGWLIVVILYVFGVLMAEVLVMREAWEEVVADQKRDAPKRVCKDHPSIDDEGFELIGIPLLWPVVLTLVSVFGSMWLVGKGLSIAAKPKSARELEREKRYRELPDLRSTEARKRLAMGG